MRARSFLVMSAAAVALAAAPVTPARANPACEGRVIVTPDGNFYIDDRGFDQWGLWIYHESNGQRGLQRGGMSMFGYSDPCDESTFPDTVIY